MKQHTLKPAFVKLKTFGFRLLSMPQNIYLVHAVTPDELYGQTHKNQTLPFIRILCTTVPLQHLEAITAAVE
jgi:hypothetical protein